MADRRPSVKKAATRRQLRIVWRQVGSAGGRDERRSERNSCAGNEIDEREQRPDVDGWIQRSDLGARSSARCLTPLDPAICWLAGKRNGISIGCELPSTSFAALRRGLQPLRFNPRTDALGEAGAPSMGEREAARRSASADCAPPTPPAMPHSAAVFAPSRSLLLCSDAVLHPPAGACGMRIAPYLLEPLARHGRRQPIEEVA
jgi:hypothetical protein